MCKIQGKTVCTCGKVLSARGPRSSQNVCGSPFPLDSSSPVTPDPRAPSLIVDEGPSSFLKRSPFSFEGFLKSRSKSSRVLRGETLRKKRKGHSDEGPQGHDHKALRSTDELPDEEGFISKIAPYGKDYLPSITGLLTSSYEAWSLDILRPKEEIATQDVKFEPDTAGRVQSSEEEERESSSSTFASLLSRDDSPSTFDPTPNEISQSFSDLISSEEPVTSYRSMWGGERQEDSLHDNWQRTAPHYSREDVDTSMKSISWYREENADHDSYRPTKFSDSSLADTLEEARTRGSHSAVKLLSKNVSGLKKKIKKFEEEFERSFGYRPSHSEKMKHKDVKKYMTDLSKTKKELKQMKEDIPDKRGVGGFQKPFPMSLLRCQESTAVTSQLTPSNGAVPHKETKETYKQVEERLSVKRIDAGRPAKVADLSLDQLKEEKTDIQKALLFYESIHGRPSNKEDKELVRPLYDRYRLVKRSVNKLSARPKESVIELAPILEHVVMDFTLASPQHRGSLKEDSEEPDEVMALQPLIADPFPGVTPAASTELNLGDLHALPLHELRERKKEAKEEKRKLRHSLREFEERFERETGRKMQKEDRGHMEKNYNEYKHVKAKLRLLEALLSKHGS